MAEHGTTLAAAPNPNDYAVVIGINHYPEYRNLAGAVQDAGDFAEWLRSGTGGGLPHCHCRLIQSVETPCRPLHDEVDEELMAIIRELKNKKGRGRRFYFFFSGHGLSTGWSLLHLCLARWSDTEYLRYALDSLQYRDTLAESGRFDEIVLFLDCCRVYRVGAQGLGPHFGWTKPYPDAARSRVFCAYATEFLNPAREAEDSTTNGRQTRGHFTKALLQGLRGDADFAGSGITADNLKDYLEAQTERIAQAKGHVQKAVVENGLLSGAIFGRKAARVPVSIHLSAQRGPAVTLTAPDRSVCRFEPQTTPLPWIVNLGNGLHFLEDEATGETVAFRVLVTQGALDVRF